MGKIRERNHLRTFKDASQIPRFNLQEFDMKIPNRGKHIMVKSFMSVDNICLKFHCKSTMLDSLNLFLLGLVNITEPVTTNAKGCSTTSYTIEHNHGIYTFGVGYNQNDGVTDETLVSVTLNPNKCFNGNIKDLELLEELKSYAIDGINLQKFDLAFDIPIDRDLVHIGFQGTKRVPYWVKDTEYIGDREYHKNDFYTKIYEKAPGITRIEITVWNKDKDGNLYKRCLKPVTIAKKIIKKLPVIYVSSVCDRNELKKEDHAKDRFYTEHQTVIEACRINCNPYEVLQTSYIEPGDKIVTKKVKDKSSGEEISVEKKIKNTYGNNPRTRNRIINILKEYGMIQFEIDNENTLVDALSFYADLMETLNEKTEQNEYCTEISEAEKNELQMELEQACLITEDSDIRCILDTDSIEEQHYMELYGIKTVGDAIRKFREFIPEARTENIYDWHSFTVMLSWLLYCDLTENEQEKG